MPGPQRRLVPNAHRDFEPLLCLRPGGKTYTELPNGLAKTGAFCWIEDGRGIANYCFVDNLVDAILLAAETAEAHGQRFIINDGTCTWREFLEPLVGEDPDRWPSLTARELAVLHRAAKPRWREALRAVAANRQLRDVLKTRMPTAAVIALARRLSPDLLAGSRPNYRPTTPCRPLRSRSLPVPPIWLCDLFGPMPTRFSSARARAELGWSPLVKLAEGQDIATALAERSGMGGCA